MITNLDFAELFLDFAGVQVPDDMQGKSFRDNLSGYTPEDWRNSIYYRYWMHIEGSNVPAHYGIRTERYKLIKRFDGYDRAVPSNISNNTVKGFMVDHGFLNQKIDTEMLFDLYLDPVERVNLVNNSLYSEVFEELSDRLSNWMKETNDPLLKGTVERPVGVKVNKRTSQHPGDKDFE